VSVAAPCAAAAPAPSPVPTALTAFVPPATSTSFTQACALDPRASTRRCVKPWSRRRCGKAAGITFPLPMQGCLEERPGAMESGSARYTCGTAGYRPVYRRSRRVREALRSAAAVSEPTVRSCPRGGRRGAGPMVGAEDRYLAEFRRLPVGWDLSTRARSRSSCRSGLGHAYTSPPCAAGASRPRLGGVVQPADQPRPATSRVPSASAADRIRWSNVTNTRTPRRVAIPRCNASAARRGTRRAMPISSRSASR